MKTSFYLFVFIILFFTISCDDNEGHVIQIKPEIESEIQIAPSKVSITDLDTATLYLSLSNPKTVKWKNTKQPEWLRWSKTSGVIDSGIVEIKAVIDKNYFRKGHYINAIEITTENAGKCKSLIDAYIGLHPEPVLNQKVIQLDSLGDFKYFSIFNKGDAPLDVVLIPSADWIRVSSKASISPNENHEFLIFVDRNIWLPVGSLEGEVKIYYNRYRDSLKINISAQIQKIKKLRFNIDRLEFDTDETEKTIELTNIGNTDYQWNFATNNPAIICSPTSGRLGINESMHVQISLDSNKCLSAPIYHYIYFVDHNITSELAVSINHFHEDKLMVEGDVIDAVFNKNKDRLLVATKHPNKLLVVNMDNYSTEYIQLRAAPTCLAVSKDGQNAVVGHDGYISHINLNSLLEKNIISVHMYVESIALTNNGWVYFIEASNHDHDFYSLDLESRKIIKHHNVSADASRILLHPSEKYIYSTYSEKYEIDNDKVKSLYQVENYSFGVLRLITDDGKRAVSNTGVVLNLSAEKDKDLTRIAQMASYNGFIAATHSAEKQKFACLEISWGKGFSEYSDILSVYNANEFTQENIYQLPFFGSPLGNKRFELHRPEAEYCFFNAIGSKIIIIMKTTDDYTRKQSWAIYGKEI